jgi:hypothetical protein
LGGSGALTKSNSDEDGGHEVETADVLAKGVLEARAGCQGSTCFKL